MFKVTVLKFKDIVKYLVAFMVIIGIIAYATRYFSNKNEITNKISITQDLKKCLNKTLPVIEEVSNNKNTEEQLQNIKTKNYLQEMLKTEISSIKGIEQDEKNQKNNLEKTNLDKNNTQENTTNAVNKKEDNNQENKETENNQNNEKMILAKNSETTEVVTTNPITEKTNAQYGKVKIKNQTTYSLTEDILKPDIKIENKNIIIFHTHSCESYTASEKYPYTQTGNYRTTDKNFSVIRVGTELENYLKQYNLNVIHNTDYHDYPSYTGSYTRSLKTVEKILKETPSDIIIDLHRDAVGSRPDYAPTVKIGDEYAAQIMFVIGTNEGGLWHPNWQQNLKFAIKIQEKAEEMYPGLFKPIMLTKSRYNQHTGKYANIIEIGSTGNTLDQCLTSMKYLSSVMNVVINEK